MAESSEDISNPQGSQGQGPSELMRGPDWSETRRATARSQKMAERVGFEPTVELPPRRISSAVLSTTQPPLRVFGRRSMTARALP